MYQRINFHAFTRAFEACDRGDQFSRAAQAVLFDYLEDMEEQTGTPFELDVIGLCCEYVEMTFDEIRDAYNLDLSDDEAVAEWVGEQTTYVGLTGDDTLVFVQF